MLKPETETAGWVERYETEIALLRYLEARGLPVPREARAVRSEGGRLLATAHRYVDGTPLASQSPRGHARERLAAELAAFLGALHSLPVAEARKLGVPEVDLGSEQHGPLIEEGLPLVGPRTSAWLRARLEAFLSEGGSAGVARVLVHGDVHPAHVFVGEGGRLAGVIDFGDAKIADPALDFAGLLNRVSWSFFERVLSLYQGPAAGDADLRRRARFYIDVVPIYEVVYGLRLDAPRLLAPGRRRLAARAAAATRAGR